jgi:hypothetical protein
MNASGLQANSLCFKHITEGKDLGNKRITSSIKIKDCQVALAHIKETFFLSFKNSAYGNTINNVVN